VEHVYRSHPSPTGEMRDGQLTAVPEAAEADTTVWFALPPENDRTVWEGLAAQSSGPGEAIIRAIPLFAYGLGYGDRVSVTPSAEGPLVATGILATGDHYAFRVWLKDGTASLDDVLHEYGEMGCYIEVYSQDLVGLSCRSAAARRIAEALDAAKAAGRLEYETGR